MDSCNCPEVVYLRKENAALIEQLEKTQNASKILTERYRKDKQKWKGWLEDYKRTQEEGHANTASTATRTDRTERRVEVDLPYNEGYDYYGIESAVSILETRNSAVVAASSNNNAIQDDKVVKEPSYMKKIFQRLDAAAKKHAASTSGPSKHKELIKTETPTKPAQPALSSYRSGLASIVEDGTDGFHPTHKRSNPVDEVDEGTLNALLFTSTPVAPSLKGLSKTATSSWTPPTDNNCPTDVDTSSSKDDLSRAYNSKSVLGKPGVKTPDEPLQTSPKSPLPIKREIEEPELHTPPATRRRTGEVLTSFPASKLHVKAPSSQHATAQIAPAKRKQQELDDKDRVPRLFRSPVPNERKLDTVIPSARNDPPHRPTPVTSPKRKERTAAVGLNAFKINPDYNQGLDYAFTETVRSKEARKCLPSCTKHCCKNGLKKFLEAAGMPRAPKNGPKWDRQEATNVGIPRLSMLDEFNPAKLPGFPSFRNIKPRGKNAHGVSSAESNANGTDYDGSHEPHENENNPNGDEDFTDQPDHLFRRADLDSSLDHNAEAILQRESSVTLPLASSDAYPYEGPFLAPRPPYSAAPPSPPYRIPSPPPDDDIINDHDMSEFLDRFGRHREAHPRRNTPPGFWDSEMPDTPRQQELNLEAELVREIKIERRRREAETEGGKWIRR
ncbi:hypothetical protein BZA77DRAFT_177913 [Pyronema omphalodes]|nr:hypothetical protein BZA77DRAFT_177913 [Pyronema omphalodes]